jgi:predicted ATP-dependent serine protease
MPKGGLRSTSFKPGVSGNPDGRPKRPETIEARRVVADVKAAARELTLDAMDTLKLVMKDSKAPPAARVGAATAILDRGWGRPQQQIDANVNVIDGMAIEEQEALIAMLRAIQAERQAARALPPPEALQ